MEPATSGSPPERPGRPVTAPGLGTGLMRTLLGRQGWPAATFVVLFAALTALVATGVAQPLDDRLVQYFRPDDVWGERQIRYSPWMHRMRPPLMFALLAGSCLVVSVWRRSWRPAVLGLALGATSAALVFLVKLAVERPDPHGDVPQFGGSYPSGHMVAVLVCLGGCLLVLGPRTRWWWWALPAAAAGLMTAALLLSAAHWTSDVVGGALLALVLLTGASRWPWRARAGGTRGTVARVGASAPPPGGAEVR
jgi:membrane-associated phospholipid phosphatase